MSKYIDFENLKINVSLPDFLRNQLGWRLLDGSSTNSPKMESPCGTMKLIFRRNDKGHYTCWNPENSSLVNEENDNDIKIVNGSTIINVVRWDMFYNHGKIVTPYQAAAIVQDYWDTGVLVTPNSSTYKIEQGEDRKPLTRTIPLQNFEYFTAKGINPEVLNDSEIWSGVFFNTQYRCPNSRKVYMNTGTYLKNQKGIVGLSIRTLNGQKIIQGQKKGAIASTNNAKQEIDKLHIFESIIDALSYYELFYFKKEHKNIQMISSEGVITSEQIKVVQELIERNNVKEIELNYDNDIKGIIYAINTIGMLKGEVDGVTRLHSSLHKSKEDTKMYFEIQGDVNDKDKFQAKYFPLSILNEYYKGSYNIEEFMQDGQIIIRLETEVNNDFAIKLAELFAVNKFENRVKMKLSKEKDFNDDLVKLKRT